MIMKPTSRFLACTAIVFNKHYWIMSPSMTFNSMLLKSTYLNLSHETYRSINKHWKNTRNITTVISLIPATIATIVK